MATFKKQRPSIYFDIRGRLSKRWRNEKYAMMSILKETWIEILVQLRTFLLLWQFEEYDSQCANCGRRNFSCHVNQSMCNMVTYYIQILSFNLTEKIERCFDWPHDKCTYLWVVSIYDIDVTEYSINLMYSQLGRIASVYIDNEIIFTKFKNWNVYWTWQDCLYLQW